MLTKGRARQTRGERLVLALSGPEQREKEARRRLALGERALDRGDLDTARYHADKGLPYAADDMGLQLLLRRLREEAA